MKTIIIGILILLITYPLTAMQFGKNKINYPDMEWSVISTTHFDIYYEGNLDFIAEVTTVIIENAYYRFQDLFQYSIKDRIPVVIYNSHNEFEETNTIYWIIDEGVGGFTEFIKNRVVVPFDGSYKRFEYTIIHELSHVFCFYALQGGRITNLASGIFFSLPLWFSEGIAEWSSIHGSYYNDMFMLDLVVNDAIIPLEEVDGYYAYREGESFLLFLESQFGTNSVIEFLYNTKIYKSVHESAKRTFGFSFQNLEDQWKFFLQRKYSIFINNNGLPTEKYQQITHHKNDEYYKNINPIFSPDGTDILYYSSKSYNMGIYKSSTLGLYKSKRLVKTGVSGSFEDFHSMKSSLSYFPDGKKFAFVTKTTRGDDIAICSTKNGKELQRIHLNFDSIFELDVSPDGSKIVFTGLKDARDDLYIYDIEGKTTSRLTDDYYDDRYPRWSPDGNKIAFASQRFIDKVFEQNTDSYMFSNLFYNIFFYELKTDSIWAVTNEEYDHQYPIWTSDNKYLIFTSYRDSLANIIAYDFSKEGYAQLTNTLCGSFSPSITKDDNQLIFSTFYKRGWDIYLYSNPLDSLSYFEYSKIKKVKKFPFRKVFPISEYKRFYRVRKGLLTSRKIIYDSNYISRRDSSDVKPDTIKGKEPEKEKYKLVFTPDFVFGGLAYSTGYGLSAQLYIALSDILGNHHINIITDVNKSIAESNVLISYYYLKKRFDVGIGFFNLVDNYYYLYYSGREELEKEKNTGMHTIIGYPIDKFNRIDFYNTLRFWRKEWFEWENGEWQPIQSSSKEKCIYSTALFYIHDTALWGYTGPIKGSRVSIGGEKSFGLEYLNIYCDLRNYFALSRNYQFASKLELGISTGKDKQEFNLGYYYNLRGYLDFEEHGYSIAVGSLEFRFPFIHNLKLGFPLPICLRNIRGAVFTDVGNVWDNYNEFKSTKLNDLKMGYGFGTRMNLGYFVLKLDWAWRADKGFSDQHPSFYFSLNAEF
ncbi:MAG: PD40 domain-containing protein [Candidatus Cloacimonetes bacterium]|nr:PD40 domain-containing protein [Candidatus Cloacimonadota bacterium]